MLVIAAAPHRQAALDGANFVMDFLEDVGALLEEGAAKDGVAREWVEAKRHDDAARDKWK